DRGRTRKTSDSRECHRRGCRNPNSRPETPPESGDHDREIEAEKENTARAADQGNQKAVPPHVEPVRPRSNGSHGLRLGPRKNIQRQAIEHVKHESGIGELYEPVGLERIYPDEYEGRQRKQQPHRSDQTSIGQPIRSAVLHGLVMFAGDVTWTLYLDLEEFSLDDEYPLYVKWPKDVNLPKGGSRLG